MNFILVKFVLIICSINYLFVKVSSECNFAGSFDYSNYFQVYFNSSSGECREYFLGSIFQQQRILVLLSRSIVNCHFDNILVFDENRDIILDFCKAQSISYLDYQYVFAEKNYLILDFIIGKGEKREYGVLFSAVNVLFYDSNGTMMTTTKPLSTNSTTSPPLNITGNFSKCGSPSITPKETETRIIGGVEAIPNSWPWQVYIESDEGCGASIINNQWLLTAAHCIGSSYLKAYFGIHDKRLAVDIKSIRVSKVIKHPGYNSSTYKNDIALIKLETSINYTSKIQPVCMQERFIATAGRTSVTIGWGKTTDFGDIPNALQQVSVPIKSNSDCVGFDLDSSQICAGISTGNIKDSCQGDSGGPLVIKENEAYVLVGIVSYGHSTCDGFGIYTNVTFFDNWIQNTIRRN